MIYSARAMRNKNRTENLYKFFLFLHKRQTFARPNFSGLSPRPTDIGYVGEKIQV